MTNLVIALACFTLTVSVQLWLLYELMKLGRENRDLRADLDLAHRRIRRARPTKRSIALIKE